MEGIDLGQFINDILLNTKKKLIFLLLEGFIVCFEGDFVNIRGKSLSKPLDFQLFFHFKFKFSLSSFNNLSHVLGLIDWKQEC